MTYGHVTLSPLAHGDTLSCRSNLNVFKLRVKLRLVGWFSIIIQIQNCNAVRRTYNGDRIGRTDRQTVQQLSSPPGDAKDNDRAIVEYYCVYCNKRSC